MKVLIVDDDLVSRSKMEVIMSSFGKCLLTQDGLEALTEFKHAWYRGLAFNLVTLDIEMPGMDGEEVLAQIREFESRSGVAPDQQAVVFMVTGLSEKDKVLKCLSCGCQDYIVKPFNIKVIQEKLQRFGLIGDETEEHIDSLATKPEGAKALFDEIVEKLKSGEVNFPSFPSIPLKFRRLMMQNAPSSAIAELLNQDIAISSKLIRMSNSAFYRGRQLNNTVEAAIGRLGLSIIEQLVNVLCGRSMFKIRKQQYRTQFERLWSHSLACAHASEIVATQKGFEFKAEAFNMGLFHDIGRLCLLQIISDLSDCEHYGARINPQSVENTLNSHHTRVGAGILGQWDFPQTYIAIAEFHHEPQAAPSDSQALWMVHVSNFIVKSIGYDHCQHDDGEVRKGFESALRLHMAEPAIQEIQTQVQQRMEALAKSLV